MPHPCRNALILHCHLPWLRHEESLHCAEEDWWIEVFTESLLPLLEMLHRLRHDDVPFKITLAVTPTVLGMMQDPLLQQRSVAYLDRSLHLALTEIERGTDPEKRTLAQWYADHYHRLHRYFCNRWKYDLVAALSDLRKSGHVELPASAATHALLPLFLKSPDVLRSQINIGCSYYQECFGEKPKLFWLPDCAYSPALEPYLLEAGLEHLILDEHALTYSRKTPSEGIYHPAQSVSGLHLSFRDVKSSREILQLEAGLRHDTRYRQAYQMSGHETPVNALEMHLTARQHKPPATLPIHSMDSEKLYDPRKGKKAAQQHAAKLLQTQAQQGQELKTKGIMNPTVTTIYEAQLFGHWRFEGIPFLEKVLRQFANPDAPELTHLSVASQNTPTNTVKPIPSSWGEGDYFENWLSQENAWIYPHLQRRATLLQRTLAALEQNLTGLPDELADHRSRCVCQMTRELLLAQSSDWASYMRRPTTQAYATHRFEKHLENFDQLAQLYPSNEPANASRLASIEAQNPLFPNLQWNAFASSQEPAFKNQDSE